MFETLIANKWPNVYDIILPIVYFFFILIFLARIRDLNITKKGYYKYLIPAALIKILGSITFILVYIFYYHSGDSLSYYMGSRIIYGEFYNDPFNALKIFFLEPGEFSYSTFPVTSKIYYFSPFFKESFFVVKVASIINLIAFNSVITLNMLFGVVSLWGIWKIYEVFVELYPTEEKNLFWVIFAIPSVFFWGSPLLKDTVSFSALCWLVYGNYQVVIKRKNMFKNIIIILISAFFIFKVKSYILLSFLPFIAYWDFSKLKSQITNKTLRILVAPVLIVLFAMIGYLLTETVRQSAGKFSSDQIITQTKTLKTEHGNTHIDQSSYSLGEIDFESPLSIISTIPAAINVTLFRPYIWEVRNIVMLMSAIEALVLFILTIYLIFIRIGINHSIKIIFSNSDIIFVLFYSLFFAFVVGFTSYNFGALVRYKIPCLPFFGLFLILLHKAYLEKRKATEMPQKLDDKI